MTIKLKKVREAARPWQHTGLEWGRERIAELRKKLAARRAKGGSGGTYKRRLARDIQHQKWCAGEKRIYDQRRSLLQRGDAGRIEHLRVTLDYSTPKGLRMLAFDGKGHQTLELRLLGDDAAMVRLIHAGAKFAFQGRPYYCGGIAISDGALYSYPKAKS